MTDTRKDFPRPKIPVGVDCLPYGGLWAYDDRARGHTLYAVQDTQGLAAFMAVGGVTSQRKSWEELQERNPWRLIAPWSLILHPGVFIFDDPKTGHTIYVTRTREDTGISVVPGTPPAGEGVQAAVKEVRMAERMKRQAFGTVVSVTDVAEDGKVFKGPHKAVKVRMNDGGGEYFFNLPPEADIRPGSPVYIDFEADHPEGDRTLWTPVELSWYTSTGGVATITVPPRGRGSGTAERA